MSVCKINLDILNYNNFYKNSNVLVTGGAGFIGSHLVESLVSAGAHVTVLDNLCTGHINNLTAVWNQINFIKASIQDFDVCLKATQDKTIIFHLAAYTSVPGSLENPRECHSSNIDGTTRLLEAAKANHVERFIFSSSAAVYGNQEIACHEKLSCNPSSAYGYSKFISELLCKEYAQIFNLKTVILRYFNVYGDRQDFTNAYASVIAKFKQRIKENLPITVFGDGTQTRDFIPVKDIVKANLILGSIADKISGEIYNIASGKSISLLELINNLKKENREYSQKVIFEAGRESDIKYSKADCAKYKKLLQL